jgi:hypothetical protein
MRVYLLLCQAMLLTFIGCLVIDMLLKGTSPSNEAFDVCGLVFFSWKYSTWRKLAAVARKREREDMTLPPPSPGDWALLGAQYALVVWYIIGVIL